MNEYIVVSLTLPQWAAVTIAILAAVWAIAGFLEMIATIYGDWQRRRLYRKVDEAQGKLERALIGRE